MRRLRFMIPVALLVTAAFAAPSAEAASTATCSSTALLQPILTPPSCTTGPVFCPVLDEGETCKFSATVKATSLVGNAGSHLRIFAVGDPGDRDDTSCGPTFGSCTAKLGPYFIPVDGFGARASCNWNISALAVLDKVTCTVKRAVVPEPELE